MGTSAKIKVEGLKSEGLDIAVYKHYDGYPEGTLPWLEKFNKEFAKNRGDDPSYKFAQLLRSSAIDGDEFNLDDSTTTGWGVVDSANAYAEYTYLLKTDGSVTILQGN